MADKPISTVPSADLPENWALNQIVAPNGGDVGLSEQHGYNYLMKKVNAIAAALSLVNNAFAELIGKDAIGKANGVAGLGADGKLNSALMPSLDYIKTTEKSTANGVAPLDAKVKIPLAYLYAAVANGLATLGSDGFVPASQLNLTAAQVAPTTDRLWMTAAERTKLTQLGGGVEASAVIADWPSGDEATIKLAMPSADKFLLIMRSVGVETSYTATDNTGDTYTLYAVAPTCDIAIVVDKTTGTYHGQLTIGEKTQNVFDAAFPIVDAEEETGTFGYTYRDEFKISIDGGYLVLHKYYSRKYGQKDGSNWISFTGEAHIGYNYSIAMLPI